MELPGDEDLNYVRRQLDDLSVARAMGVMTDDDRARYEYLCDQERQLLTADERHGARHGLMLLTGGRS